MLVEKAYVPSLLIAFLILCFGLLTFLAVTHPFKVKVTESAAMVDIQQGAYLFETAGCANCHEAEDGSLGGGHGLKSPFGTFYAPNISKVGNGWSEEEFIVALKSGVSPDGQHYYPAFPYTTYQHMSVSDIRNIFAYMKGLPSSDTSNKAHDVSFPANLRRPLGGWKMLFLGKPDFDFTSLSTDPVVQRGAYLVNAVAHCGECHSPRNSLGGHQATFAEDAWLSGGKTVSGKPIPSLRQSDGSLGEWSKEELIETLTSGFTPGFEMLVEGDMDKVVKDMAKLSDADIDAVATYLMTLE